MKIASHLGILSNETYSEKYPNTTIESDKVLQHIKNITEVDMELKSDTCKVIREDLQERFTSVLKRFYDYLQKNNWNTPFVQPLSCILVDNNTRLEVPEKALLKEHKILPPYLNYVSVKLGQYFDTFEGIGCAQYPTALHYLKVLEELKRAVGDTILEANLQNIATKAVRYLGALLEDGKHNLDGNNLQLYLPTVTFKSKEVHLTLSTAAIFVDDFHVEKRLHNFDEQLLLIKYGKADKEKQTNGNLVRCLPRHIKPRILSHIVTEELLSKNDIQQVGDDHFSESIKARLISPMFLSGIERLIKHEAKIGDNSVTQSRLDDIVEALKQVKVYVLSNVKTQLRYDNRIIKDSQASKHLFMHHEHTLQLYLSAKIQDDMEQAIYSEIAFGILKLVKNLLRNPRTILLLPLLLRIPTHKITALLDENSIARDTSESNFLSCGELPEPGDLVPLQLHCLLKNDFDFVVGEYVALENRNGDDVSYVYAVIRCCKSKQAFGHRIYGVQTTPDEKVLIDKSAYDLYRFERGYQNHNNTTAGESSSTLQEHNASGERVCIEDKKCQSYEEIVAEIRKELQQSADLPSEARKTVVRRLYLRWHPDKTPRKYESTSYRSFSIPTE